MSPVMQVALKQRLSPPSATGGSHGKNSYRPDYVHLSNPNLSACVHVMLSRRNATLKRKCMTNTIRNRFHREGLGLQALVDLTEQYVPAELLESIRWG